TTYALEDVISDLEGGSGTKLFSSGLSAIAVTIDTFVQPGEHLLIVDTVYQPVRRLLSDYLAPRGVEYTFYSPRADNLEQLIRRNTRMIYAETPGSLTMELQDIQALAETAKKYDDILVACDNTW